MFRRIASTSVDTNSITIHLEIERKKKDLLLKKGFFYSFASMVFFNSIYSQNVGNDYGLGSDSYS